MKLALALFTLVIAFFVSGCEPDNETTSYNSESITTEMYDEPDDNYNIDDLREEVGDWMKEQAEGKDYTVDDGGEYYCMGKNDTCPNKTKNAYDLFCSACDPDGDNIEG